MNKKQSTTKGFAILSAAGILNKVLAVIYVPILTFLIGNVGNGIYNAGYQMYLLVFVITNTGIPIAISKLVSEQLAVGNYKDSHKTLEVSTTMLVVLGLLMSIITALGARAFSNAVNAPRSYLTILALSPTMLFTAVACSFRGYFQGRANMTPTAVSQIIEQFLNSLLTIIFAWIFLRFGVEAASAGGTVGTSVGALGSASFLVYTYRKHKKEIKREIVESNYVGENMNSSQIAAKILQYGIPITLGAVAIYTSNIIDLKYTLGRLEVAGFSKIHATALYGILTTQYQKLLNIPLALTAALSAAIMPGISSASTVNDIKSLHRKINQSLKANLMVTIPSAVGLAVLAKPIISLIFTNRYNQGSELMMIGSVVLVLTSFAQIQTSILQGVGKTYIPTINMVIALIIKIFINYNLVAIRSINVKGAVVGSIVCYLLASILNHIQIKKYTKVKLDINQVIIKPLIASIMMGICAFFTYYGLNFGLIHIISSKYILNAVCTLIAIFVGAVVYSFFFILLKGISAHEIERIPLGKKLNSFLCRYEIFRNKL